MLHRQLIKYGVVGVASNGVLYLLYLLLTYLGLGHKTAMTLLYVVGVLQTYFFNRNWTFSHGGHVGVSLARYVAAYGLGYLVNLVALMVLVDRLGLPHRWVQGGMIFAVAGLLFLLQRYWVFPRTLPGTEVDTAWCR